MNQSLPQDSLFAGMHVAAPPATLADVPEELRSQIQDDSLIAAFHRLEVPLRLLLHATTPGREPESLDRVRQVLDVWRFELEHRLQLRPDAQAGTVQPFDAALQAAYTVKGRCVPGDLVRIRVPCWRLKDRLVVRGEAEPVGEGVSAPPSDPGVAASPPSCRPSPEAPAQASGRAAPSSLSGDPLTPDAGPAEAPVAPDDDPAQLADAANDEPQPVEGTAGPAAAPGPAPAPADHPGAAPVELWELVEEPHPGVVRGAVARVVTPEITAALEYSLEQITFPSTFSEDKNRARARR